MGRDRKIIADIVSKISLRALGKGRNPDRFKAEFFKIIEFLDNARYIADAVVIAIEKRAGIDLINRGFLPPLPI